MLRHSTDMRKHYIDNLRWIIILLLIPYHAAMAWNVWGEPNYMYFGHNNPISSIVVFLSPYLMPSLFLIAGMCARFSLQKRTVRQFVLERTKRLLIPFVFGVLLIMPLMTYIADKYNYGYEGNFFQHYFIFFTKFTDLTGADGGFSAGQFCQNEKNSCHFFFKCGGKFGAFLPCGVTCPALKTNAALRGFLGQTTALILLEETEKEKRRAGAPAHPFLHNSLTK